MAVEELKRVYGTPVVKDQQTLRRRKDSPDRRKKRAKHQEKTSDKRVDLRV